MNNEQLQKYHEKIDTMDQLQMAARWRFAEAGDVIFSIPELFEHFKKRFNELGGMTSEISKKLGW